MTHLHEAFRERKHVFMCIYNKEESSNIHVNLIIKFAFDFLTAYIVLYCWNISLNTIVFCCQVPIMFLEIQEIPVSSTRNSLAKNWLFYMEFTVSDRDL
jgi:hypothetical protein